MLQRARTLEKHTFPSDWSSDEIRRWLAVWKNVRLARDEMKRIVFVSGVFDLYHQEHQSFLEHARSIGNFLVVGIESDLRVKNMKGPERPFDGQRERCRAVISSGVVDQAEILPENFSRPEHHRALIGLLRPDFIAVSSHSPYQEAKSAIAAEFGGKLKVVYDHNPDVSTTKLHQQRTME